MDDLDDEIFEKPSKFDIVMRIEWSFFVSLHASDLLYCLRNSSYISFEWIQISVFHMFFFTSDIVELVQAYTH